MPSTVTMMFIAGGAALVIGYIAMLKIDVSDLEDEMREMRTELVYAKSQVTTFKSSIAANNVIIEAQKLNIDVKNKELEEWKTKPPKVKYETIYRDVVKDSNLTGECDEVKKLINSVTDINLNTL